MHRITFESPFYFGDLVDFNGINGSGRGRVSDIILQQDMSVYYYIELEEGGETIPGIYPKEMRLVHSAGNGQRS